MMINRHHFTNLVSTVALFIALFFAPVAISTEQQVVLNDKVKENLEKAFLIGKEVGYPETLQAILLQETNGGMGGLVGDLASPVGRRSYGLMQVQVVAARSIFQRFPDIYDDYFERSYKGITDEEIIALLITNDEANMRIAAYHFKLYLKLTKGDWHKAVAAYNAGIGAVKKIENPREFGYVRGVIRHLTTVVRKFNKENGLELKP